MTLPLAKNYAPMEAQLARELPQGTCVGSTSPSGTDFDAWRFATARVLIWKSKSGKPLTRYLSELAVALLGVKAKQFVLDGEIVIPVGGNFSFDDLLMRIHPAASRVEELSKATPCVFISFSTCWWMQRRTPW